MKASVEEISSIKRKMFVEIPEDQIHQEIDSAYQDLGKKAKIKGFRQGKVPRNILEQYFKDYVKSEVIQKLIQDSYPQALSETALQPVSMPAIDPGEFEPGKPFQYSAVIEVKPEINLQDYNGLKLEGKKAEVKEEEVEERLSHLQNLHSTLKTLSEVRPIQKKDFVILDYEAVMDGKPVEGGKAVDFSVEVGSGQFIPALEEALIGLKPEEEKEVPVTFPKDYGYRAWAEKTVLFRVKVKEIKEKVLPALDDEFAKDLGSYESFEELKTKIREEIRKEKEMACEQELKDKIVDHLLEVNSFEVPEGMVEEQTKALISDTKLRLAAQGVDFKNLGISEEKLHEDYRTTALKQVRAFLILEKIAAQEGITLTDEETDNRLSEISEHMHQKLEVVKRYYEQNALLPEMKASILRDKTLKSLIGKAEIHYE